MKNAVFVVDKLQIRITNVTKTTNLSGDSLTVGQLVDYLGSRSIRVLTGDSGLERVVTGTELIDAGQSAPDIPGALMFVVSGAVLPSSVLRNFVEQAAELQYSAVAMKTTPERRDELCALAENAGVTLLEVAEHVSWQLMSAAIEGLLGEQNIAASTAHHPSFEPLFSLVNTVAERFGGSTVIEDLSRNIVAYSSVPGQLIDELRTEGILTRRAPYSPYNDEQYRLVLRAENELQFTEVDDEEPRIAIAIRAGNVPLGTLWAIDGRPDPTNPLTPEDRALITDLAETAASHMLDNLRIQESNQKPREAAVRRLISGNDVVGTELAELGFTAERGVSLTAIMNPGMDSSIALAQARSTIAKHYSSYHDGAIVISLNGTIYALIGTGYFSETQTLAHRVLPLIDRVIGQGSRAAVTDSVSQPAEIAQTRNELDAILRCAPQVPEPKVLQRSDVQPQLVINRIADLIAADPLLQNDILVELAASSSTADHELLKTLEVWCAEFGNVSRTAETLGVHENTVRYRINRLTDQYHLRVRDPDTVLTIWLQLRALAASRSAPHPAR